MEDNITEDYVSFETAKLLKEKGFNRCPLFPCYKEDNGKFIDIPTTLDTINYCFIPAPTIQRAMKWLRKSYNITVLPGVRIPHAICGKIEAYWVGIWYVPKNNGGALCFISPTPEKGYSSYEEACEAGIKYSLEHLI
jgi:hypothetical protein